MTSKYCEFNENDNPENIIYLSDKGWSVPNVGIWYDCTKTGILTIDIGSTIKIVSSGITLDGKGHKISNCDTGIIVNDQEGIIIKNINFENRFNSIVMDNTHNSQITKTSTVKSEGGIFFNKCNNNTITNNYFYGERLLIGINLFNCNNNCIKFNSIDSAKDFGVILESCDDSNLYRNSLNNCRVSILSEIGNHNKIIFNKIKKGNIGINLLGNKDSKVEGNYIYETNSYPIVIKACSDSYIYSNSSLNKEGNGITIEESKNIILDENKCKIIVVS